MNFEHSFRPIRRPLSLMVVSLTLLSCAESLPEKNDTAPGNSALNNRAIEQNTQIQQVFGSGFLPSNDGLGIPSFGFVGNTGGFGFSGSIASIIGNMGGFGGFGGFGAFASFLAGSLPTSPPAGFIPPPGTGTAPIAGIPPANGNFGPPPGTIFGPPPGGIPGAGFVPPVGFTPPPAGFVPPFNRLPAPAQVNTSATDIIRGAKQIDLVGINLAETETALAGTDLDLVFVAPASNNIVRPLAITETITPCAGGGTRTLVVDDVDPVGPSSGDSRTTTFADCVRAATGGTTLNGSRGFTTDSLVGAPFLDPVWSTQTSMSQTNFTRSSATYTSTSNGTTTSAINVDATGVTQTATGSGDVSRTNLTTNTGYTHTYTFNLDFTWNEAAQDFTIGFAINIDTVATQNSQISVDTTTPLSGTAGAAPTAGQVVISVGSNNVATHIETLTAQADGTVLVESDTNGDGVPDATRTAPNWGDVLFELFNAPI